MSQTAVTINEPITNGSCHCESNVERTTDVTHAVMVYQDMSCLALTFVIPGAALAV